MSQAKMTKKPTPSSERSGAPGPFPGALVVLGVDPGFASLGFCRLAVRGEERTVEHLGVVKTSKENKKRAVYASDDNVRRIGELTEALAALLNGVHCVCAEAMSFPRSASVANKMGIAWGVLGALCHDRDIPIIQASPQELKKSITGNKTASKEAVQDAVSRELGESFTARIQEITAGMREHPSDAAAAALYSLKSDVVKATLRAVASSASGPGARRQG